MGLFDFLRRLLGFSPSPAETQRRTPRSSPQTRRRRSARRAVLVPLRRPHRPPVHTPLKDVTVSNSPYRFSRLGVEGGYLDLSQDGNVSRLERFGLPVFHTPKELANWLGIGLGRLAWLTHRCDDQRRPADVDRAHYHFRWVRKKGSGYRLIESPKPTLKAAQEKILREILDRIPLHTAAHGFAKGRSIRTNALPHTGQRVVIKMDLRNFYPSVTFNRVVAIFRSLGYCRESAIWLASLTTSMLPHSLEGPPETRGRHTDAKDLWGPYCKRHLPQGACTSPALANLSAFSLDLRLAGLSRTFRARYTRYADDLTFSGDQNFLNSLPVFLRLVQKIINAERFRLHPRKRKVMRNSQQQRVTGVVVNEKINVPRKDYDNLKAILTNCVRRGPSTQNHERHPEFASYLMGRIAHVQQLHADRGARLRDLFDQIDWDA